MEFISFINTDAKSLVEEYILTYSPDMELIKEPLAGMVEDGKLAGLCSYKLDDSSSLVKSAYLYIHVAEPFQNRTLTRNSSLLLYGFNLLDELSDTEYADYRGVKALSVNPKVTEEVMEYLGFKVLKNKNGKLLVEKVFTK